MVFGSSASCTTISASSISNRKPCNPSTTPSAQGCHPCLRYVSLPMSPVRTVDSPLEGTGFEPSVPRGIGDRFRDILFRLCGTSPAVSLVRT